MDANKVSFTCLKRQHSHRLAFNLHGIIRTGKINVTANRASSKRVTDLFYIWRGVSSKRHTLIHVRARQRIPPAALCSHVLDLRPIVLFVEIARASNATRHRREGDAANAPCGACQKDVQQTTRRRVDAKEFPVDAVFVRVKYDIIIHSYRIVFVQSFT